MQQKEILEYFTRVTSELQEIITSTGEEQLNATPADGAWSIAQIAEHLRRSYAAVDVMNGNVQPYGPFTRMEWMYFNIFHTHRHLHQMKEILKN